MSYYVTKDPEPILPLVLTMLLLAAVLVLAFGAAFDLGEQSAASKMAPPPEPCAPCRCPSEQLKDPGPHVP